MYRGGVVDVSVLILRFIFQLLTPQAADIVEYGLKSQIKQDTEEIVEELKQGQQKTDDEVVEVDNNGLIWSWERSKVPEAGFFMDIVF